MVDLPLISTLIYALATYRVTRFFIMDDLFSPLRERIWVRFPPESTKIGYLFTCFWCLSVWIAVPATLGLLFGGTIALAIALIFALSALVGLLQTFLER